MQWWRIKQWWYPVVLVGVLLVLAGCGRDSREEFRREDPQTQSDKVKQWVEAHRQEKGTFTLLEDQRRYYLLTMGEKPTGGYAIQVQKLLAEEGELVAVVELKAPARDEVVTQALTYPLDLISLPAGAEEVTFAYRGDLVALTAAKKAGDTNSSGDNTGPKDTREGAPRVEEGGEVPVAESTNFRIFAPAPESVISSPVRVRGQARVFEATFTLELEDGHNILAEQVVTAAGGAPEWGEFDITLPFAQPSSSQGMLLFIVYSAKDGSREEQLTVPVRFSPGQ